MGWTSCARAQESSDERRERSAQDSTTSSETVTSKFFLLEARKDILKHSVIIPGNKVGTSPKNYSDNFSVKRKGLPVW